LDKTYYGGFNGCFAHKESIEDAPLSRSGERLGNPLDLSKPGEGGKALTTCLPSTGAGQRGRGEGGEIGEAQT